ncbi:MAG: hypothetical protein ACOY46_18045 [Bacillota bacterium]
MKNTKKYLRSMLQLITARIRLNELIQEYGPSHPKVKRYQNKVDEIADEISDMYGAVS